MLESLCTELSEILRFGSYLETYLCGCGYVAMWLCGYMAMWLCGYVASWLAMWLWAMVAMWLCGYVAMWLSFKFLKFSNFHLQLKMLGAHMSQHLQNISPISQNNISRMFL